MTTDPFLSLPRKIPLFSRTFSGLLGLAVAILVALPSTAFAQVGPQASLSLRDTFPVGTNGLCEAQIQPPEPGDGLFDRTYAILCRDAARSIGTLWVVRDAGERGTPQRFAGSEATCATRPNREVPEGLRNGRWLVCSTEGNILRSELLIGEVGGRTYAASGLAAYDSALALGLASLVRDRVVAGEVDIPLTQTTDEIQFARQQAESISADQALGEAYRRSNSGEFAEAAEFFAASASQFSGNSEVEARLNEALLQSNLGNYSAARRGFVGTRSRVAESPVLARLQRNYEAIDALNRDRPGEAVTILDRPLSSEFAEAQDLRELKIGPAIADRLAAESDGAVGRGASQALTPLERAQLLDGQARYLRATSLRQTGERQQAAQELALAEDTFSQVREGRVLSIAWLRAQVLGELAELAEREGDTGRAEGLHRQALELLSFSYPESPAFYSAQAQLAGLYARTGRREESLTLYRDIVARADGRPSPSLRRYMADYFELLMEDGASAQAAGDMFSASQLLLRPGLAQTQAVLARELSGGSDEASLLFRRSVNLARSIEALRASNAQLEQDAMADPLVRQALVERREQLAALEGEQAQLLQRLAEYPRFRAVSGGTMDLAEMQAILRADEAYVKMIALDRGAFMVFIQPGDAIAFRVNASPDELEGLVDQIRGSIAIAEAGQVLTFPFDIEKSRELYARLFAPVADRLPGVGHVIFEPDGAMLKLPINLLVTDDQSVARYQARLDRPDADEFDFRDVAWLGRSARISTSVAPSAFRDVRAAPASSAQRAYLGLGENTPIGQAPPGTAATRSALAGGENCTWSRDIWANPIRADELYDAAQRFGGVESARATVITRDEFTDTAIRTRENLDEYRVLHFATHGLVTAPEPQCPPRPALLTSFGEGESDGLLSFAEIFGLRIDADLVILSACDTAGSATVGATIEAGITSGGDFALDGLVRAFVGAGGRTVLASHWPVPDTFDATERLISGLFEQGDSETAEALRQSQLALMDDANTSHPFYWSAFAVVGDGASKVTQ